MEKISPKYDKEFHIEALKKRIASIKRILAGGAPIRYTEAQYQRQIREAEKELAELGVNVHVH